MVSNALQRLMFGIMYRIGFTPWDGHALPARLRAAVEGPTAMPPRRALDIGCGTGDTSIYLAQHGWDVTAVDFVAAALRKARAKADAAGAHIKWIRGDVTALSTAGVQPEFDLIVDSGCFHGLSDEARDAYVREVTTTAARDARIILAGFAANPRRRGPRGVDPTEVQQRFAGRWSLVGHEEDRTVSNDVDDPIWVYELRRTSKESTNGVEKKSPQY